MSKSVSRPASSVVAKKRIPCCRVIFCIALLALPLFSGCATVGRDFPAYQVGRIRIGETTREDIRGMFGPPWREGIEDGTKTWTYGKYQYGLLGGTSTKDLVVRFDERGVVTSYTYNTTTPSR